MHEYTDGDKHVMYRYQLPAVGCSHRRCVRWITGRGLAGDHISAGIPLCQKKQAQRYDHLSTLTNTSNVLVWVVMGLIFMHPDAC